MLSPVATLEIGRLAAAILTRDPGVARLVRSRYAGFMVSRRPDWRIEVSRRPEGIVPIVDVEARPDGARLTLERHDFLASLDLSARSATVALGVVDAVALDAFLRVAWSLALLDEGAVLVHASSLVRDGLGYAFPGPSGAGKTTIARLSPGAALLSDEISLLRVDRGRGCCHGTPFWGGLRRAGENREAPLSGLYFPRKDRRHTARRLTPREALESLLPNVLFFATDAGLRARAFAVAADLSEAVPAFDLGFRRDPGFWEVIGVG